MTSVPYELPMPSVEPVNLLVGLVKWAEVRRAPESSRWNPMDSIRARRCSTYSAWRSVGMPESRLSVTSTTRPSYSEGASFLKQLVPFSRSLAARSPGPGADPVVVVPSVARLAAGWAGNRELWVLVSA
ncbi:hypothetical protein ACFVHB_09080 [Kitasatospora sp. NPDC127111]|uniref:hypothetical protein n=1 Tax=Kitasatospora sp. NPDC127111 TaxID=3345363 RepID=UPI00362ED36E